MTQSTGKAFVITTVILIIAFSCKPMFKEGKKPGAYDLDKPEKFFMPESLVEISGIAFRNGKTDTVYVIEDEDGKLFRLPWKVKKQYHTKFAKKGDYEDLCIIHDTAVILKSNGHLYSFPMSETALEETSNVSEWKDVLPDGEYEGIYAEDSTNKLYVVCKNCPGDNNKDSVSGFILHRGDSMYVEGNFFIDVNAVKAITGKVKRGFRPSALAKNPVTGEWFILSAVNKLLVVTDKNWKVKDAFQLSSNIFNQPEGIAFDTAGDLYISNEGDKITDGNILKFVRQTK